MFRGKEIGMPVLVLVCVLVLWEGIVRVFQVPLFVLPAPSMVLIAFIQNWEILFSHALTTLCEALIGLCIAVVFAILVAIAMDRSKHFRLSIYPHLVVSQTIPVMVLAPLFSIWFGFGMTPKVIIVIMMCFFPVVIAFADGMAQVDKRQVDLLKSYQASSLQIYTMVKIPAAASSLFSGLKVAATYCVGGAIVGEWISSNAGLGYYMLRVKNGYMLDKVFATVLMVIVLSLLLNGAVKFMERMLFPHLMRKSHK